MTKTAIPASMMLVNGLVPERARLVCAKAVKDENHQIGAALVQFTTGIYVMVNAGVITSCNQNEAAAIDKEERKNRNECD